MNTGYARKFEVELQTSTDGIVTTLTYSMIAQPPGSLKVVPPGFTPYSNSAALAIAIDSNYANKVDLFLAAIPGLGATRKGQLQAAAQYSDPVNCALPVTEPDVPPILSVSPKMLASGCWSGNARIDIGDGLTPGTFVSWAGTEYEQDVFDACYILTSGTGDTCPIPSGYGGI